MGLIRQAHTHCLENGCILFYIFYKLSFFLFHAYVRVPTGCIQTYIHTYLQPHLKHTHSHSVCFQVSDRLHLRSFGTPYIASTVVVQFCILNVCFFLLFASFCGANGSLSFMATLFFFSAVMSSSSALDFNCIPNVLASHSRLHRHMSYQKKYL